MNHSVHRLNLAANLGMAREHCKACKTETLHRQSVCVHCGTHFSATQSSEGALSLRDSWDRQAKVARARK